MRTQSRASPISPIAFVAFFFLKKKNENKNKKKIEREDFYYFFFLKKKMRRIESFIVFFQIVLCVFVIFSVIGFVLFWCVMQSDSLPPIARFVLDPLLDLDVVRECDTTFDPMQSWEIV